MTAFQYLAMLWRWHRMERKLAMFADRIKDHPFESLEDEDAETLCLDLEALCRDVDSIVYEANHSGFNDNLFLRDLFRRYSESGASIYETVQAWRRSREPDRE